MLGRSTGEEGKNQECTCAPFSCLNLTHLYWFSVDSCSETSSEVIPLMSPTYDQTAPKKPTSTKTAQVKDSPTKPAVEQPPYLVITPSPSKVPPLLATAPVTPKVVMSPKKSLQQKYKNDQLLMRQQQKSASINKWVASLQQQEHRK